MKINLIYQEMRNKHITLEDYIGSYGWAIEDCTPTELSTATRELAEINKGKTILDGILAFKYASTKDQKTHHCIGFDRPTQREAYRHFAGQLILLKDYGDMCNGHCLHSWDDGWRRLYRCAGCGGLVLMQRSYFNNYDDADERYDSYFPIDSEEEAQQLNEQVSGYDLEMGWRWRMVALKNGQLATK